MHTRDIKPVASHLFYCTKIFEVNNNRNVLRAKSTQIYEQKMCASDFEND